MTDYLLFSEEFENEVRKFLQSVDELLDKARERRERAKAEPSQAESKSGDTWISCDDAAAMMHCTKCSVSQRARAGYIKSKLIGKKKHAYSLESIESYMKRKDRYYFNN